MRAFFPNAEIVIDRFHMVQMLTRSLNSLRMQSHEEIQKDQQRIQTAAGIL